MASATHERESTTPWLRDAKAEAPAAAIEKMPQFGASLDRFVECAGGALANLWGGVFAGAMESLETAGTFEWLSEHEGEPAALLHSAALEADMAIVFDFRVVDSLINSMFGANPEQDASLPQADSPPRPRTELETRLVGEFAKCLALALQEAFAPVANFDLSYESLATIVDTNLFGAKEMQAISAKFSIKAPGGVFGLDLVMPQPWTTSLSRMFPRGPAISAAKVDPGWARRMEQGVSQANLTLTAILDEFEMTLGELSNLTIGRVLPLNDDGQGRIRIECVERGVFLCKLGERNNRYALEVEDIIASPAEAAYSGTLA